jgi:hypothetical protein
MEHKPALRLRYDLARSAWSVDAIYDQSLLRSSISRLEARGSE